MKLKENRLIKYILASKAELKKVTWPTRKETIKLSLIVIGISAFVAIFLGVLDFVFVKLLSIVL